MAAWEYDMLSLLASVAQQVPAPQEMRSHPSVWRFPRHAPFCGRGRPGVARLLTYIERALVISGPGHRRCSISSRCG